MNILNFFSVFKFFLLGLYNVFVDYSKKKKNFFINFESLTDGCIVVFFFGKQSHNDLNKKREIIFHCFHNTPTIRLKHTHKKNEKKQNENTKFLSYHFE